MKRAPQRSQTTKAPAPKTRPTEYDLQCVLNTVRFARALRERDIAQAQANVAAAQVDLARAMCRRY